MIRLLSKTVLTYWNQLLQSPTLIMTCLLNLSTVKIVPKTLLWLEQSSHNNTTDTDSITRIFNKLGTDIKPIKISRLGKPNNKSRPLKIELQAASEVFKILGLSRNLKSDQNLKDIRLTSDKSPYQ